MEKKKKSKKKSRRGKVYEYRLSTPQPKIHTLGLAGFIVTIIGIFTSFLIPLLLQIIALVMSHVALNDINRNEKKYSGRGLIIASLIINYIFLAIAALIFLVLGVGILAFFSSLGTS
jgi:hypothetical protein